MNWTKQDEIDIELGKQFATVMRIHGIEQTIEGLDKALSKLKRLESAAESALRAFTVAGVKIGD